MQIHNVVLVRMDKIGDLVLSLPADELPIFAQAKKHWFISSGMEFIADHASPPRIYTAFKKWWSWAEFCRMIRLLRQLKPQMVIVLYAPWWVGLAALLARVNVRIGRLSQWHSYLFFNYGVRQSRSQSQHHESMYNTLLIESALHKLNCKVNSPPPSPLQLVSAANPKLLAKYDLQAKKYIVVHPGMFGSALNWPLPHYVELVQKLVNHSKVVITGTQGDRDIILKLKAQLKTQTNIIWSNEQLSPEELLSLLQLAQVVIAPSTGVLHLAASLNTPCVGIYSPRQAESVVRWGPRGKQVTTLSAPLELDTAEETMGQISVESVYSAAQNFFNHTP